CVLEDGSRFSGSRHVGAFGHGDGAGSDHLLGSRGAQLVLGCTWQSHGTGNVPDASSGNVLDLLAATTLGVLRDASALDFLDLAQQLKVDAAFINDVTSRVGSGDNLRTQ